MIIKMSILKVIFIALIAMMVILFAAIIIISALETEESGMGGFENITGAMENFEVSHETAGLQYTNVKTSKRFDDNYFEYLEGIQESRDKTFMRGKVFLREK